MGQLFRGRVDVKTLVDLKYLTALLVWKIHWGTDVEKVVIVSLDKTVTTAIHRLFPQG